MLYVLYAIDIALHLFCFILFYGLVLCVADDIREYHLLDFQDMLAGLQEKVI